VMRLAVPFAAEPERVFDVQHRCLGWLDLDEPHQVLLTEHDRDRRWLTTWVCHLADPERRRILFDHSMDDAYADPGSPLMTTNPDGSRTVLQDGSAIYLRGDGSTPDGDRPFLDRLDLATMEQERLYQSPADSLDHVLGFPAAPAALADTADGEAGAAPRRPEILLWHESNAEPPNLYVAALDGVQGEGEEDEPPDAAKRRQRLRLRGHAAAEGAPAGKERQVPAESARLGDRRADGRVGDRRRVDPLSAALHVGELEPQGCDAALGKAVGDRRHRPVGHARARPVGQHQRGACGGRRLPETGHCPGVVDRDLEALRAHGPKT